MTRGLWSFEACDFEESSYDVLRAGCPGGSPQGNVGRIWSRRFAGIDGVGYPKILERAASITICCGVKGPEVYRPVFATPTDVLNVIGVLAGHGTSVPLKQGAEPVHRRTSVVVLQDMFQLENLVRPWNELAFDTDVVSNLDKLSRLLHFVIVGISRAGDESNRIRVEGQGFEPG